MNTKYKETMKEEEFNLLKLGLTQGVYVPHLKLVEEVKKNYYSKEKDILAIARQTWLRSKNYHHESFMMKTRSWLNPAVINIHLAKNFYPTDGSSSGFRYIIQKFGNDNRDLIAKGGGIWLMEGEYEGYTEYAKDARIPIKRFDRNKYKEALAGLIKGELIILSEPSGIDGNYWPELEDMLNLTDNKEGVAYIDLAYHGTTQKIQSFDMKHECLRGIFFSFSKSFGGCFYDRIGGVFSKDILPGLIGNLLWFKNSPSHILGEMLLDAFPIEDRKLIFKDIQQKCVEKLNRALKFEKNAIIPSDVMYIGTRNRADDAFHYLNRADRQRFVFSPLFDKLHNQSTEEEILMNYLKVIKK